jgi:hypothetical protein
MRLWGNTFAHARATATGMPGILDCMQAPEILTACLVRSRSEVIEGFASPLPSLQPKWPLGFRPIGRCGGMKRLIAILLASLLLGLVPAAQAEARTFKNCVELRKTFKYGVSLNKSAVNKGAGPIFTPRVNAAVYRLNKKMDTDRDNIVCEVVRPKPKPVVVEPIVPEPFPTPTPTPTPTPASEPVNECP